MDSHMRTWDYVDETLGLAQNCLINNGGCRRNATDGSTIGPAPEVRTNTSAMGPVRGMLAV